MCSVDRQARAFEAMIFGLERVRIKGMSSSYNTRIFNVPGKLAPRVVHHHKFVGGEKIAATRGERTGRKVAIMR